MIIKNLDLLIELLNVNNISGMLKRVITLFLCNIIIGCSSLPTPEFSEVIYDYQVKPPYALTSAYKKINISLDTDDVKLPEPTFKDESFNFKWTPASSASQIAVYIHLSNSFLIERENTIVTSVIYDSDGKGGYVRKGVQRGYIRTHYTIEVVDKIKDTLINQVALAGNFPIEADLTNDLIENKKILKSQFYALQKKAREQLLNDIWRDLKTHHLSLVQTTFGQVTDKVVSKLSIEPKFNQAYLLLKTNRKRNAIKALDIYNSGMALYKDKDDDLSIMIRNHLDHGITVSSKIANHEYPDRYK